MDACFDTQSRVFFQYKCEQTEEELIEKKNDANIIVGIQLLTIAIVIIFLFASKERTNYLVNLYNTNNVQAVDYTMYLPLKKAQMDEFDRIYTNENKEREGVSRGQFLVKLLE